jgi:C4-dicarboxylate-specific signal transduction histidine kinase
VLGSILQGLGRISSTGLALGPNQQPAVTELSTVLDEARIVIEPGIREAGGTVAWNVAAGLPLVQAEQHGLLHVFLNLARNSQRAIGASPTRELMVEAAVEGDLVTVRFRDTGCGVSNPDELFKPFQSGENSTGLGLYISRAILRAHGGDLKYEPQAAGSCFCVELWPAAGLSI